MGTKINILIALILAMGFISAQCIDINTASAKELDKIIHVGEKVAERIIETRPFSSVNDLKKVRGLGSEDYIKDIKEQGLACTASEILTANIVQENIKSEENKGILGKNLALYGIIAFCAVFGVIFLFRTIWRKSKNEFR